MESTTNARPLFRKQPLIIRFQKAFTRYWPLYLMMVPGILFFFVYKYLPFTGLTIAFRDFAIRGTISESPWYGFYWFERFWNSSTAWQIIENTLVISLSKILIGMVPPLIFALAINECAFKRYARFIQTVSYLPHFLSWIIVFGIATTMFNEGSGVINRLISNLGGTPIPFLTSNKYARGMLVVTDLWHSIGWSSIVYLAAIMGIDTAMYESARIDGEREISEEEYAAFIQELNDQYNFEAYMEAATEQLNGYGYGLGE